MDYWLSEDGEVCTDSGVLDEAEIVALLNETGEMIRGLRAELETRKSALSAVKWYFDQRDYQVSPAGEGAYYAHHVAARRKGMAPLVMPDNGSMHWPSPYMAIKACQHHAACAEGRGDRRGEEEPR